jgi:hypothetical protein
MFSSVRKVVVHQAFAKSGFSSPWIGRLYYMNRRFWATVTNTFAGHCIKLSEPRQMPLFVSWSRSLQIPIAKIPSRMTSN